MPVLESSLDLACSPDALFEFFLLPANLLKVSPPDLHVKLVEAPNRLELGSRVTIVGRRWGIAQRMTTEVITLDLARTLTDEQRDGPFRAFRHARTFSPRGTGVTLMERIEFEAPGGLVGLMITAARIQESLMELGAYRFQALQSIFDPSSPAVSG